MQDKLLLKILDKLEDIDSKVQELGARIDRLEAKVQEQGAKLDRLEAKVQEQGARLDSLEARFDSLEGRLDSLETRFESLEVRLDASVKELMADINRLEKNQLRHMELTQKIYAQTVLLTEKETVMNVRLNTIEDVMGKTAEALAPMKKAQ